MKKGIEEEGCRTVEAIDARLVVYRKLAEEGDAFGQFCLGSLYTNGLKVAVDDVEAVKWYRLSAAQGYAHAQCSLGCAYENGTGGVSVDKVESVKWYKKSCCTRSCICSIKYGLCIYAWLRCRCQ